MEKALGAIPRLNDPNLLVGTETADDAGVYRVSDDLAVINTVDFFTPIVDDPYTFGAIAVANALSDVYSMGGAPLTALNLVMWDKTLPEEALGAMLRGGADTLQRARCALVGGHSVDAPELMYGVAVTGTVHPKRFVRNCDAEVGDTLILTKPLGVGILATAAKYDDISEREFEPAVDSMLALNDTSAGVMLAFGARASTDVTGFGLLGHVYEMAKGSGVSIEITAGRVPVFDGVFDMIRRETRTRAPGRNRAYIGDRLLFDDGVSEAWRQVLLEAETSGGLVLAFPPDRAAAALDELHRRGVGSASVIGSVVRGEPGAIRVVP